MKIQFLKRALLASVLFAGLSLASCKNKTGTDAGDDKASDDTEVAADTVPAEGMSSVPVADTIVRKHDTVVDMGTNNDIKDNPAGTQVP